MHYSVFCPYERVATVLNNYFRSKDKNYHSTRLDFNVDGAVKSRVIMREQDDVGFGFSVEERMSFSKTEEIEFSIKIASGDQLLNREVVVIHDLYTTVPYTKGKQTNTTLASNEKVCANEALTTVAGVGALESVDGVYDDSGARPFYQYICTGMDTSGKYVIHGPAVMPWLKCDRVVSVNGTVYPIGSTFTNEPPKHAQIGVNAPSASTIVVQKPSVLKVFFKISGSNTLFPVQLLQKNVIVDGRPVGGLTLLQALKLACFCENLSANGQLGLLPGEMRLGDDAVVILLNRNSVSWSLAPECLSFYEMHCVGNNDIAHLFKYLSATEKDILISGPDGAIGRLYSTTTSSSCFVLSFATMMSLLDRGSFITLLQALNSMVEAHLLRVQGNGKVVGKTASMKDHTLVTIGSLSGVPRTVSLSRVNLTLDSCVPGVYILGFDPSVENKQVGEPDHYIVVRCDELKHLWCCYDPLGICAVGADVTTYSNTKDAVLIRFDGDVLVGGLSVDLQDALTGGCIG